jgi:uncharacterized protein YndB with AHSA1/START domain
MRVASKRELLAPPPDVWAFLSEPHNLSDWWPGIAAVHPDRRGAARGARWRLTRTGQPSLFRRAGSGEGLVVTEAREERRFAFQLPEDRLDVVITLEPHAHDRTLAEVEVRGPILWGTRRLLARQALGRIYDLCQTSADH